MINSRLGVRILIGVFCCVFCSCSTQKNTWATRTYHSMTTKYNIYFNGNNSFQEGLQAIDAAAQDDYSAPLPMYAISNEGAASAATSQMDRTIEKCRKCIKLHSIKKKPKPNPNKRSDPKYKLFMQKEEYNTKMGDAWLLLGKAEFHKGEYLSSVGTFNYIIRHYETDKDIIAQCQLWIVRAYSEMGWMYEAEDMLNRVRQDDLARKHAWLYAATTADLRLKQKQWKEAKPFLKLAMDGEKREQKTREMFILAQLEELEGKDKVAAALYKKVINRSPSSVMDFNARLRRTELGGDVTALKKMAKQPKYKDKLDYIYGAIGNIYLERGDTVKALENYELAREKSTENGLQKASILIKAGDLYYERREYVKAGPCYQEAVNLIPAEREDYVRLRTLAETLDELITEYNTVQLQDSLQRLSQMTEEEQLAVAKKIIEDLEKAEKEAAEKAEQAARNLDDGPIGVDTRNMLGRPGAKADWYFYNQQLLRSGKQDFAKKWGNRQLEDNWRRVIKTGSFTANTPETGSDNEDDYLEQDSLSLADNQQQEPIVTDVKDPQYYLQQIPKTEADIAQSDTMIAQALYNMVYIYHDKLEDQPATDETIEELNKRFPQDGRLAELYFRTYLSCMAAGNDTEAALAREQVLTRFPDSKEAAILRQPDYFERMARAQQEQDSLYEATYAAYQKSDFKQVKENKQYAEDNFPMSSLMPRFLFLNALSVAKTENQDAFVEALRDMVRRYPESELGAMAKDMLAMMNQGMESQTGDNSSSLLDRRTELALAETDSVSEEQAFSADRKTQAVVLLVIKADEANLNKLLYEVALFNFSQFLIKDFDLKQIPIFALGESALQVSGFDSYDETVWYCGLMQNNADLQRLFTSLEVLVVRITEENKQLLGKTGFTVDDYRQFQQANGLE